MKDLLEKIFWIETQMQLAHWQEEYGFRHEQLGKFYEEIQDLFDLLIESYSGFLGKKIKVSESLFKLQNDIDINDALLVEIRKFIETLKKSKDFEHYFLQNVLDDIATLTERYSYLLNRK